MFVSAVCGAAAASRKWLSLRQKRSLCPQNHSVLQKQLNAATASCGQTQGLVRTTIPWLGVPTIDTVFGAFRMKNVLMASSAIVGAAALVASPAAAQELEVSGFQHFFASGGDAAFDGPDLGMGLSPHPEIHSTGSIMAVKITKQ